MNRYTYNIICEDVRQELHGKTSLMGVYPGAIYFPNFPAMIPKLCILINIVTAADKPFKNVSIRGTHAGEELFVMVLDEEVIAKSSKPSTNFTDKRFFKMQAMAKLSFVVFEAAEPLVIDVVADGEVIPSPSLAIRQGSE